MGQYTSSKLLDTGGLYDFLPAAECPNAIRGNVSGAFGGTDLAAWTKDECGYYKIPLNGSDDEVTFDNVVPACGLLKLWLHAVVRFDTTAGEQYIYRQYQGANDIFSLKIDTNARIDMYCETGGNTARAYSAANMHSAKICQIDAFIDLTSVTGLQLFCDGIEATYGAQQDPTGLSEIGNTGNFTIGHDPNSMDGGFFCGFVATYIPSPVVLSQLLNTVFTEVQ